MTEDVLIEVISNISQCKADASFHVQTGYQMSLHFKDEERYDVLQRPYLTLYICGL